MKPIRDLKKIKDIKKEKEYKKQLLDALKHYQKVKEESENIEFIIGKPIGDINNE